MRYRRSDTTGGTYFFTVNLAERNADTLVRHVGDLREVIKKVKATHPFSVVAMVVLPEHLHAIWRLPPGDAGYPTRWSLLKAGFSRRLDKPERLRPSRLAKRERGIWQRRYWEHQIRDAQDLERHVAYIHFNPVKHGWVKRPVAGPHSTPQAYIARGMAAPDWGECAPDDPGGYGER